MYAMHGRRHKRHKSVNQTKLASVDLVNVNEGLDENEETEYNLTRLMECETRRSHTSPKVR